MNVGAGIGAGGNIQRGSNGQVGITGNISAGKSNMNTTETVYQNGAFSNVNEVHNGTGTMTLDGFNQVGGTVTGSIANLNISSKQNTSSTSGSSSNGSIGIPIVGGGAITGSAGYSKTTGDRAFVDNQSSFIVGEGSNLVIGNATNIGSVVGTVEDGKIVIQNYHGEDIQNYDTYNTTGGSIGISTPTIGEKTKVTGVGVQYQNKEIEGTSNNTVIGNVSIGSATGDEINRDETKSQEITKNTDTGSIDAYVEGGVLDLLTEKGREEFAANVKLAGKEINDIKDALDSSLNEQGEDNRNFFGQLSERRQATTIDNMTHNLITELGENAKAEDINKIIINATKELGYNVEIIVSDTKNTPSLENKAGEAYFDSKTGKMTVIINADSSQNATTQGYMGTAMEELSHVIAAKEGKRDLDVSIITDEKGSESLGKETSDYFKDSYKEDSKSIDIKSDGADYSNVDFGDSVGDKQIVNPIDLSKIWYTKKEQQNRVEQTFKETYGDKYYVDWEKYKNPLNVKYRAMINYYYLEALNNVGSIKKKKKGTFTIAPENEAVYHNYDLNSGKINISSDANKKYVDYNTGKEVVIDSNGNIVKNSMLVGTFNFFTYKPKNDFDKNKHTIDIMTWIEWGTGINDTTTRSQRIECFAIGTFVSFNYESIQDWAEENNYTKVGYNEILEFGGSKFTEFYNLINITIKQEPSKLEDVIK